MLAHWQSTDMLTHTNWQATCQQHTVHKTQECYTAETMYSTIILFSYTQHTNVTLLILIHSTIPCSYTQHRNLTPQKQCIQSFSVHSHNTWMLHCWIHSIIFYSYTQHGNYTAEYIQSFPAPTLNTGMLHCWIHSIIPCINKHRRNVTLLNTISHSLLQHTSQECYTAEYI